MRTTVDIEDDLLLKVKEMAHRRKTTTGNLISLLLREALSPRDFKLEYRNGVPVLPRKPNGPVVTMELVNRLRDQEQ